MAWLSCMQAVVDIHIVGLTEWSSNGNSTISQMKQVFALLNFQLFSCSCFCKRFRHTYQHYR